MKGVGFVVILSLVEMTSSSQLKGGRFTRLRMLDKSSARGVDKLIINFNDFEILFLLARW